MTVATTAAPVTTSYVYDGDGRRVQKTVGSTKTTFVYDAQGHLAAEYGGPTNPLSGTTYLTDDHLGSTRLVTNATGTALQRFDYAPFGEELTVGIDGRAAPYSTNQYPTATLDGTSEKFTSKERDSETGLDFFGARYFSGAQGRFASPDSPLVDQNPGDPQSWNLYSYVRNNPLIFNDPTGNDCVYVNSSGNGIDSINNQNTSKDCGKTGGYWVDGTVTNARFAYGSLILTGTTDGTNRTSASYGLGPDPGLLALQEAGNRASRDITTSAILMAGTATAIASTYAVPAMLAASAAAGEAGVLVLGKGFQIVRDATGKVHGDLPKFVPKSWSREQLMEAAQELKQSIEVRSQELIRLGEEGGHRARIEQERQLLRQVEKKLGGS